MQDM
jgi:hypothetical protein